MMASHSSQLPRADPAPTHARAQPPWGGSAGGGAPLAAAQAIIVTSMKMRKQMLT